MGTDYKDKYHKRLILLSRLLFLVYLLLALYFLLFAEDFGRNSVKTEYAYNLEFFKEIRRYINWAKVSDTGFKMMLLNVWGNVVCFIPFGILLPAVFRRIKSGIIVTVITFASSFLVETFQLVLKVGSFDVDDLMLNTLGGFIGYMCYLVIKKIFIGKKE